MAYATHCPGSLRPVPSNLPGDCVFCEFCDGGIRVTTPPLEGLHDPWRGSKEARLEAHPFVKPGPRL
jgi:hypothetical protein